MLSTVSVFSRFCSLVFELTSDFIHLILIQLPRSVINRPTIKCGRPGRIAQSVTCLATDASRTADPGVASSIPARSHTFVEIDHEIISTVILPLPLNHSRRVVVSYKRKYVHEVLVKRLFKLARKKCG